MSMASRATRLMPVTRSGDAEGSWWAFQAALVDSCAALAYGFKPAGRGGWRREGIRADWCEQYDRARLFGEIVQTVGCMS